ncbi:MAG: lamin tail domain-containing protein, partial [Bacteroidota bacterium]
RTITTGNYLLAPDAYVVLCATANAGEFTGNVIGMPSFDGLSNAGETVTLRDEDNARDIDVVSYTDDWYKDNTKDDGGFTLELVNPTLVCSGESNWFASDDASGGTPAQQNSVLNNLPDTQSPTIQSAIVMADNQLTVAFNEVFQEADLQGASYSTNNGLLVTSVAPQNNNQEVLITFNSNLTVGIIYTLTVGGLADCAGNPLTENQVAFGSGASPTFQQVIITEIMADPDPVVGLPELEYIEIYNTTDQVLQLAGCQLTDGSGSATFPNFNLLPNTYLIVCTTGNVDELQSFGGVLGVSNFPSLTNSGKQLTLLTTSGRTMFTVTYSDNWYRDDVKQEGGYSLEMIDVQAPCVGSLNWIGAESPTGGTPGQPNSIQESRADNMPPQLLRADAIDEGTIILQFDEQMDSLSLVQATYSFDPAVSLQVIAPESPDFTRVTLKTTELLAVQTTYQVTVEDVSDCSGNTITTENTSIFGVPEQAIQGDIILNEILFNPRTGGSDFVELYNNSDKFVDLQSWQLANTENDEIDDRRLITEENYILPPGSYVAITEDVEDVRSNYPSSVDKPFLEASSLPSYNDDEGSVVLIDNLNEEVQRFDYEEDFHFDLIDDEEGVSLERISFTAPVNDPNSWFSAASTAGFATPGAENSQQRREGQAVGGINVAPKAFVPDNDGFSDFTTIDYSFTQGGYVANVSIYDNQGREIKRLAQNQLLATSGFFTWDGT